MTEISTPKSGKALRVRVNYTAPAPWRKFKFIQNDDLKDLSPEAKERLKASVISKDFVQPFYVWADENEDIYCLDGRHRTLILEELIAEGYDIPEYLPANYISCKDKKEAAELVLVYSSMYAKMNADGLANFLDIYDLDFAELSGTIDIPEFDRFDFEAKLSGGTDQTDVVARSLQERFGVPPFSIFDSRQGYWQKRKALWHQLGFNSQASREEVELIAQSGQSPAIYELRNKMRAQLKREPTWDEIITNARTKGLHIYEGASVFDPVLAEICYRWFVPKGGTILDPFAGGSVRGIVAGILGYHYWGIDLRKEQVEINAKQWDPLDKPGETGVVIWQEGDSNQVLNDVVNQFDFIFSCPPYHDLEQYSDDPADLSNMDYPQFLEVYRSIISKSVRNLRDNRFACFVVGDIRDKSGFYRDFVGDTVQAFRDAGMELYNEIVLINVAGSLPVRIGRQFEGYRKVGKMHQNVLVFYKGDPRKIKEEFPEINAAELLDMTNDNPNITLSSE